MEEPKELWRTEFADLGEMPAEDFWQYWERCYEKWLLRLCIQRLIRKHKRKPFENARHAARILTLDLKKFVAMIRISRLEQEKRKEDFEKRTRVIATCMWKHILRGLDAKKQMQQLTPCTDAVLCLQSPDFEPADEWQTRALFRRADGRPSTLESVQEFASAKAAPATSVL